MNYWQRKALGHVPMFFGRGGGGGGGGDVGAAAREQQRQQRIAEGTGAVNTAFGNSFNDDYYGNIANMYKSHYAPLIEEQYQRTLRDLPYQFASTGSSEFQRRTGELEADYQRQLVDSASQAQQFANDRRANVENQRQNLIGQVTSGADPGTAATLASGVVKSLSAQPTFSAVGDLFAKYTANAANAAGFNRQQLPNNNTPLTFPQQSGAVSYQR